MLDPLLIKILKICFPLFTIVIAEIVGFIDESTAIIMKFCCRYHAKRDIITLLVQSLGPRHFGLMAVGSMIN